MRLGADRNLRVKGSLRGSRRLIVAVAALLFAFQSYAIGSHVHPLPTSQPERSAAPTHDGRTAPPIAPKSDDGANCPICQELLLYGSYVLPAVAALSLPSFGPAIELAQQTPFVAVNAVSHNWQGRAPPRI